MGRPSKYTPELVEEICERLSKGEPLAQICRDDHMPRRQTVHNWMDRDEAVNGQVARAREDGFERIATDCLEIIDSEPSLVPTTGAKDGSDVTWKKARAEVRMKLLACWDPKRYGNKIDHTSGGNPIPAPVINLAHDRPQSQAD